MSKYSFGSLRKHSFKIRKFSRDSIDNANELWEEAFQIFSEFYAELEAQPRSVERNVKLLLATKFINHVYSAFILIESGLFSDATICERSAIESLAGYKLLCIEPNIAELYDKGKFPKPVEVRKRLEQLGYGEEARCIKDVYSPASGITHLSRDHERFSMSWKSNADSTLHVGGVFNEGDLKHMLEFLPILIAWFLMPLKKDE